MQRLVVLAGLVGVIVLNIEALEARNSLTSAQAASPPVFTDMTGHWAADAVRQAVAKGYVDGYPDGTFKPDRAVTRAEFVAMLAKALRWQLPQANGAWYEPYVQAAVAQGIHRAGDFASGDWNTPITRQDMMRLAVRAVDEKYRDPKDTTKDKYFVYAAAKKGLLRGVDDTGTLMPDGTTTRAQAVTVIERVLTLAAGGTLPVDKYAVNRAGVYALKTNMFDVWPELFGGEQIMRRDLKGNPVGGIWNPDELYIETPDGKYRGELDAIILIDLDDPTDPHRGLVPINEAYWENFYLLGPERFKPLRDVRNAYVIYDINRQVYNKDPNIYGNSGLVRTGLWGLLDDEEAMKRGEMKGTAGIALDTNWKKPLTAGVISKKIRTEGYVAIDIAAPAIPPYPDYRKYLLWAVAPEEVG